LPWFSRWRHCRQPTKNTFDFSKEKIHEEATGSCVDGGDRTQFYRSSEGSNYDVLPVGRVLCIL
jgi:hypothetical protein